MPASLISQVHAGPAWVLLGDPTTALGADLVELGLVPSVDVKLELFRQAATNELGQALADGVFGAIMGATVTMSMQQVSAAILAAMVDDIANETTAITANTALQTIAPVTMVIVPADVKGSSALTNLKTQYLPAVYATDIGSFVHQLRQGGGDDSNPYTVTFRAAARATDQDGQALHEDGRIWFRGSPVVVINETTPAAWSLPSGY